MLGGRLANQWQGQMLPDPNATNEKRQCRHEPVASTPDSKEAALSELVIFEDGADPVEVRLEGETVWLTQKQMAELIGKDLRTVNEHVGNVYEEGELDREELSGISG